MFTCKAVLTYWQIGLKKKGNVWILLSQNVELYLCYLILFNCMSDFITRFLAHEVKYQKDLDCADYIHHYLKWIWWKKNGKKKMKFTKVVLTILTGFFYQIFKITKFWYHSVDSGAYTPLSCHWIIIISGLLCLLNISWVERLCKPWWWVDFIATKW